MDFVEQIKVAIPVISFLLSCLALIFTRRSWFESNRPIVSAEIATHDGGNVAIMYNLIVHNTGNRPAVDIHLIAQKSNIDLAITKTATSHSSDEIRRCFSTYATIPLLHQGKSTINAFGATSSIPEQNVLVIDSKIPIQIRYKDLNGKSYTSTQVLIVKDSDWFAGSGWERSDA